MIETILLKWSRGGRRIKTGFKGWECNYSRSNNAGPKKKKVEKKSDQEVVCHEPKERGENEGWWTESIPSHWEGNDLYVKKGEGAGHRDMANEEGDKV